LDLSEVPPGPTLLVANEFLDCLPVRQWVMSPEGWREKLVGLDAGGRLAFGLGPPDAAAGQLLGRSDPPGAVREIMPGLAPLIDSLAMRLAAHPGACLLVDYGSDDSSAGDTLQALRRHTKVAPLDHLGEADLTAHVDFARLAARARTAGLQAFGPAGQGDFLRAMGIGARADNLMRANPSCADAISSAMERLTDPCHMGRLFKAVALLSKGLPGPPGF
jgi:NADH dehydrogenase [ubiquinone] 1 alpha subcomplex assembly factor 7